MPQIINTNSAALNAQRNLNNSQVSLNKALQRLSSGLRINSAKDDAAGLAISERFQAQIRGLGQGIRNASDAISMTQTAEGVLTEIGISVQRIRELAVQAKNATNSSADRDALSQEVKQLQGEIARVAGTKFNGVEILKANAGSFNFQVGADTAETIKVTTTKALSMTSAGGLLASGSAVQNVSAASKMIKAVDNYLKDLNAKRAILGAVQNRFDAVVRNGQNVLENLTASRSRIVDADFAEETANLTRSQILQQAGTAMLAQANQIPQNVLSLLR